MQTALARAGWPDPGDRLAAVLRRLRVSVLIVLLLLLAGWAGPAARAADTGTGPVEELRGLVDRARAVLDDGSLASKERDRQFADILRAGFDFPTISRLALGRAWRMATTEQRERFVDLFTRYLFATYAQRLGGTSGRDIRIEGSRKVREDVIVSSFVTGGRSEFAVDWRMRRDDNRWRVIDLVIEQVSMLVTQRSELASIIEHNGGRIEGLLAHLGEAIAAMQAN